jgi:hypothetical protein
MQMPDFGPSPRALAVVPPEVLTNSATQVDLEHLESNILYVA